MDRHFLFLQGLPGPFFRRLAKALLQQGGRVSRINFNGGDWFDWRMRAAVSFRQPLAHWPEWLERHVTEHHVTDIVLFGEFRPPHRTAFALNAKGKVRLFVFEEGFLRPYYATLEMFEDGKQQPLGSDQLEVKQFEGHFRRRVFESGRYWLSVTLLKPFYRHYRSHRPDNAWQEFVAWCRRRMRRAREYYLSDRAMQALGDRSFFLFPLQLDGDAQIRDRSPFGSISAAVEIAMSDFAANAPAHAVLLFKRHPLDPSVTDWRSFVKQCAQRLGVANRVLFVEYAVLESLLSDCEGVVTINSTVGPLALAENKPVFVMADAVYGRAGLVHQGALGTFWTTPTPPSRDAYNDFVRDLKRLSQTNGGFHSEKGLALLVHNAAKAMLSVSSAKI
jgi:capsular polysaccharide export protein